MNRYVTACAATALLAGGVAVLYPMVQPPSVCTKEKACMSNLKQLGAMVLLYASDNDGHLPLDQWVTATSPYGKGGGPYECPSITQTASANQRRSGYALNVSIAGRVADRLNRTTVLLFETDSLNSNVIANLATRSGRHDGASNVAFIDGHVKRARLGEVLRGNP